MHFHRSFSVTAALLSLSTASTALAAFPGINGRLLFSAGDGGVRQIFSIEPDGSELRRLSEPGQEQFHASFSADGTRIAFQCGVGAASEICVMNADGTGKRQLTFNAVGDTTPVFSPDGAWIAFSSTLDGDSEIYIISSNSRELIQITHDPASDFDPAWSPGGDHIAFTRIGTAIGSKADIILYEISTATFTNLTNDKTVSDRGADFSPDGSQIAFVSERDGDLNVYVMNLDGSAVQQITDNPAFDNVPAWSPDGKLLAFDSDRVTARRADIYTINADGSGNLTQLTFETDRGDFAASWQPLSPEQAIDALIDDLTDLVRSGALPPREGALLAISLRFASRFLRQGNVQAAITTLELFIAGVEFRIQTGVLTPEEGQPLSSH